jgi:hypothetical protein
MINELLGNSVPIANASAREWDRSGRRFGDINQARSIDFTAKVSLQDGLNQTIHWTRENHETVLSCILEHAYFVPEVLKYNVAHKSLKKAS